MRWQVTYLLLTCKIQIEISPKPYPNFPLSSNCFLFTIITIFGQTFAFWLPQSLPDMKVTNKCVNRNGIWLYQIRGLNPMGPCHTHVPHFLLEWKVCWCKGKITWNFAFTDCFPEAVGMVGD